VEDLTVAAGAARHVLPNAVDRARDVVELLHVAAQEVDAGEAPGAPIRARAEVGLAERARRQHARRVVGRYLRTWQRGLGDRHELSGIAQIDALRLELLIVLIVGLRVGRGDHAVRAHVDHVSGEHFGKWAIVTDQADHCGRVVVQRRVDGAIDVRPRRDPVLEDHAVELGVLHRDVARSDRVVVEAGRDALRHRRQDGFGRRYAREAIVHSASLLTGPGEGRRREPDRKCDCERSD
jgi:hypothetical protein